MHAIIAFLSTLQVETSSLLTQVHARIELHSKCYYVIPRGIRRPDRCARDQPYNYYRKSSVIICSFVLENEEEEGGSIRTA